MNICQIVTVPVKYVSTLVQFVWLHMCIIKESKRVHPSHVSLG